MRKIKNYSFQFKVISTPTKNNNNNKKLTKDRQEILQKISASGFKNFSKNN